MQQHWQPPLASIAKYLLSICKMQTMNISINEISPEGTHRGLQMESLFHHSTWTLGREMSWICWYHLYRLSGPPQFRYPVPSDRGCRLSNAPVYMHGSQTTASAFNHHSYVFTWFVNCRMCWLKHHLQHMSRSCGIWHYKQRCPCIQTNNLLETSQELKKMQEIGGEWKR